MKKKLLIDGMGCAKCVAHVKETLENINGVIVEDVQVGSALIDVHENVQDEVLKDAIYDEGYTVTEIENL